MIDGKQTGCDLRFIILIPQKLNNGLAKIKTNVFVCYDISRPTTLLYNSNKLLRFQI